MAGDSGGAGRGGGDEASQLGTAARDQHPLRLSRLGADLLMECHFPLANDVHSVLQCHPVITELVSIVSILLLADGKHCVGESGWYPALRPALHAHAWEGSQAAHEGLKADVTNTTAETAYPPEAPLVGCNFGRERVVHFELRRAGSEPLKERNQWFGHACTSRDVPEGLLRDVVISPLDEYKKA